MYPRYFKRVLDLVVACSALLLLSPLILVVAILVRYKMGSPVLFEQKRPGLRGQPFRMLKFRSMTESRNNLGELLPDSERLTRFGTFLRRTSLDELPELLNVVRGEMSLVGPRPLLMRYYPFFTEEEQLRFSVRPGITGLAQVFGRNNLSWDGRIALDTDYVRRSSCALDLKLILLTFWRVVRRDGVQVDPGAVMLDFDEERKRRHNAHVVTP